MKIFFRSVLLLALTLAPAAFAQRKLGDVTISFDKEKVPVHVSASTPELEVLAHAAFGAHGRYKLVASGGDYDIRFSPAGPAQVRVEIAKGLNVSPVASETRTGANLHEALYRAADFAVEKTNGLGLKGFFTARLAFLRDFGRAKEICTSDLFFSSGEVKQLTRNNVPSISPRWSPDGAKIIYTTFLRGFPDIYVHDLASNRPFEFAKFQGTNSGARYSPNGAQVAMVLSGEGQSEIYVGNAQGRQIARRTRSDAVKSSPCWSPDGTRLVFVMEPGPQLYVMPAGGGAPTRLPTGFSEVAEPDWSRANPNKIACTVGVGRGSAKRYQIAVYDFATGKAEIVSKADFDAVNPSWLADGRHLVYTARDRATSVLSILDTETGQSKRISAVSLGATLEASVWTP